MEVRKFIPFGIVLLVAASCNAMSNKPPCLESHVEKRHRSGRMQMLYLGNNRFQPIYHPGYDYEETVCDKYGPESYPKSN